MDEQNLSTLATKLGFERARIASANLVASCPFAPYKHLKADGSYGRDYKASFGIRIERDGKSSVFNCFSCASKGDLMELCNELAGLRGEDYTEIEEWVWEVETLTAIETFDFDELSPAKKREQRRDILAHDVYDDVELDMFPDPAPVEWLDMRGISAAAAVEFDLRDDPEEGRVLFPMRRLDGKLIGLSGRTYRNAKSKYFPYLVYPKERYFFGEWLLSDSEEPIVVVEGQIDVVKVRMAGFDSLAILGGSCSATQQRTLEFLRRDVILLPDPGETGKTWSHSMAKNLNDVMNVYRVRAFEEGRDPGDCSPEELQDRLSDTRLWI